jgi:hypothetical protein
MSLSAASEDLCGGKGGPRLILRSLGACASGEKCRPLEPPVAEIGYRVSYRSGSGVWYMLTHFPKRSGNRV